MHSANIVTLFKLLRKYDGENTMTLGHWRIARGGYDIEFEIYAKVNDHELTFARKFMCEGFEENGYKTAEYICGYNFDVIEPVLKYAYNSRYDFDGKYDWKQIWSTHLKKYKARKNRTTENYD